MKEPLAPAVAEEFVCVTKSANGAMSPGELFKNTRYRHSSRKLRVDFNIGVPGFEMGEIDN
jgi:hypothetical protein